MVLWTPKKKRTERNERRPPMYFQFLSVRFLLTIYTTQNTQPDPNRSARPRRSTTAATTTATRGSLHAPPQPSVLPRATAAIATATFTTRTRQPPLPLAPLSGHDGVRCLGPPLVCEQFREDEEDAGEGECKLCMVYIYVYTVSAYKLYVHVCTFCSCVCVSRQCCVWHAVHCGDARTLMKGRTRQLWRSCGSGSWNM